jgi:uncharacterized membrane protein YkgB
MTGEEYVKAQLMGTVQAIAEQLPVAGIWVAYAALVGAAVGLSMLVISASRGRHG